MSYVVALPEVMSAAATDVASIGSVVATASQGVAGATTTVLAAAEDEVSAAIAALFSAHGQDYQALSAQLAVFHERFVQALTGAARGMPPPSWPTLRCCRVNSPAVSGTVLPRFTRKFSGPHGAGRRIHAGSAFRGGAGRDLHRHAVRGCRIRHRFAVAGETPAEFVCARNSLCNPKQSTFSAHCQRHTAAVVVSWQLPTAVAELAAGTDGPVHHL